MVNGFSSADPRRARGPQVAAKKRSLGRSRKRTSSVRIGKDTVFIDGRGFSVAPSQQEQFIRQKTGGRGTSARRAMEQAAKIAEENRRREAQKKAELEARSKRQEAIRKRRVALLTAKQRLSLIAQSKIKRLAQERGRGFTKSEVRSFIKKEGGSISELRKAQRTGVRIIPEEKIASKKIIKGEPSRITQSQIDAATKTLRKELSKGSKISAVDLGTTVEINNTIKKDVEKGKASKNLINIADIVTGGLITENTINKDQSKLNKRVSDFNTKFGGKELSESEFNNAQAEKKFIDSEQDKINKRRDKLVTSKKDKINDFFAKLSISKTPRLTTAEQEKIQKVRKENKALQAKIRDNQPQVKKKRSQIEQKREEIKNLQSNTKRTIPQELKLFRLKNQVNTLTNDIQRLQGLGGSKILAGTVPISGVGVPRDISKISFVGVQKAGKGGKVVTDIIFQTKKGTQGIARGVSLTVKGETASIVTGRFGKVSVKLLKGKKRISSIKTFVGVEKAVVKGKKFTSSQLRRIAKFTEQQKKKGVLNVIKTNIKGLQQSGIGRVATIKGKKFFRPFIKFPSGKTGSKLGKGIDLDAFSSVSAVLTKKQLSAIIGKTITFKGGKAEFIGLIKSAKSGSKLGTLTTIQKQQYAKATQKLFSSVAAAVAKAEKTSGVKTKALKYAAAASILSKGKPVVTTTRAVRSKQKLVSKKAKVSVATTKPQLIAFKKKKAVLQKKKKSVTNQQKSIQAQINKQKNKVRQIAKSRTSQKSKQLAKQKISQKISQLQAQKQKLGTRQKLIAKQIVRIPTKVTPVQGRIVRLPPVIKKKKKSKIKKSIKEQQQVFNVFGKSKGKFVKLNVKPLKKGDALSKGAFAVDRTTARTFKIVPAGKTKTPGKLSKSERNYFNRQGFKLREVRIKKGRKFQLKQKYIEKSKHAIDTRSEKGGLTIAKLLKQQKAKKLTPQKARKILKDGKIRGKSLTVKQKNFFRSVSSKKPKRKITPSQKKKMLANLKKARATKKKSKGGSKKR
jgi:hypothetical protein